MITDDIYEELAAVLDRLPNGFPRTSSNVEILLLKKIFSREEAELASTLSGEMEFVYIIAERARLSHEEAQVKLINMARRGFVWLVKQEGKLRCRLAPFIVGIYEAQLENMDHELAHLFEEYMANGGAAGIMKPQPALHRVIPAQHALKSEWILPYDDVRAILLSAKTFRVRACICRVQQEIIGHRKCSFSVNNCLSFSTIERSPKPDDITKEEALRILDQTEEVGLVHTVSNVMKGIGYVCNCCGCCCGILRGITEWGITYSVAYANYYAVIDAEKCLGCGVCIERCQVRAISEKDGVSVVETEKCIGCGLCVTGCPNDVAKLLRKLHAEIVHPPLDYKSWEQERLRNRGLNSEKR